MRCALMNEGSLNFPFLRDQTMQMDGNFEGFPFSSALCGFQIVSQCAMKVEKNIAT